jgi:Uri superfamily endonuclease
VDSGVYIAIFQLANGRPISAGGLGRVFFPAGLYLYVGSAQRNLSHRLSRHARQDKPLRWHIDYLSRHARMVGALVIRGGKELEMIASQIKMQFGEG